MDSFFFSPSDKHSKRVRDLHLLKKLSALLDSTKSGQGNLSCIVVVREIIHEREIIFFN